MRKFLLIVLCLMVMWPTYATAFSIFGVELWTRHDLDADSDGVIDASKLPAGGTGTGDVVGPNSAVGNNFVSFNSTTGKLIKDSGSKASDFLTTITGNESAFIGWDKNASDDFTWDYDFDDLQNVPAYLLAETDPDFAAWLLATPPLYTESDPAVGTHESTYDHTLIGTALQSETDPTALKPADIGVTVQAAGSYEPAFDFGTGAGDINTDDIPEGSTHKYEKDSGTNTGDEPDASSTVKGIIEIADDTEALAGTDTSKAVTPAGVKIYADANDTDTVLSDEQVQDKAGAMFSGNTETRATVTYQDDDGTIDVVVDDMNDPAETSATIEDIMTGADAVTTPADADTMSIVVSGVLKKVTWANIVANVGGGSSTGYITLPTPHSGGSGLAATPDTDFTNATRGQVVFSNSAADTTNYVEYRIPVPTDMDTSADIILESFFVVAVSAGTNTSKQRYYISMDVVASDAAYSGTVARPATIDITETASTATGDVVGVASPVTLTDWKTDLASHEGEIWVIRVARDGDDATNDSSVIETFSGPITLKYTKE